MRSPNDGICEFCDDADATHVVLADTGDHINSGGYPEAGAAYCVACPACKDRGYMDPEPLTELWIRWFANPWSEPPHAEAS